MAKRFTDTEIWQKDWFLDLPIKQKLLVKFIFDNCDCAGIYEISYRVLKNCFGEEIKKEDFEAIKQVKFISENKIFIEDFIKFQYGISISELDENKNVHKGILKKLSKINIFPTLEQGLANPKPRVQDKDKDKDKDKVLSEKEDRVQGEGEKENKSENLETPLDPYFNSPKEAFITEYKKVFGEKPALAPKHLFKLTELAQNTSIDFIGSLPKVLNELKKLRFNWRDGTAFAPKASWLLNPDEDNFIKMLNGEFSEMLNNKKASKEDIQRILKERREAINGTG